MKVPSITGPFWGPMRNAARAVGMANIRLRRFTNCYPASSLAAFSFIAVLVFSYFTYHKKITAFGDALKNFQPSRAHSFVGYIINDFFDFNHSLGAAILGGIYQRVAYYFAYDDPMRFPWWIDVGLMQFSLVASPFLLALFFKRIYRLSGLAAFLVFFFILSTWSVNPSLVAYSLNAGNGQYPIGAFLFAALLLISVQRRTRAQLYGSYALYAFVLSHVDIFKLPALIFFLGAEVAFHTQDWRKPREYWGRTAIVLGLFGGLSALSWFTPGFQRRLGAFRRLGVFVEGTDERLKRIPEMIRSAVENTYPYLFSRVSESFDVDFLLLHAVIAVCLAALLGYAGFRHFHRSPLWRDDWLGLCVLVASLAAFHMSFVRVLVSLYHGDYANSAPAFLLAMFLAAFGICLTRYCPWEGAPRIPAMLAACIALVLLVLIPNMQDSAWQIRLMKAKFRSLVSAYQQVLRLAEESRRASGEGPPPKMKVQLTGIPVYGEFNHSRYYQDISLMLLWKGVTNVEVTSPWRLDFDPQFPGATIRMDSFLAVPYSSIFRRHGKPRHVRTVVSYGQAEFDYWIPSPVKRECAVYVDLNPNFAATPQYRSLYRYHLAFVTGFSGQIASLVKVTPVLSAESMPPVERHTLSATWLLKGRPAAGLPLNPGKGKAPPPRIVRFTVKGGHPKYSHANAELQLADCR